MSSSLHFDWETRSAADLREVGLFNYVNDPTTDVWCLAWAIGAMEPAVWTPGMPLPRPLVDHVTNGGLAVAHNVMFDMEVWNAIGVPRYGFPELRPEQCECTMATGYAMGLPGALEDAAFAMGLKMLKDAEGRALMLRMARPRSKRGVTPIVWWDEADKIARLHEYCKQDVRVERELHDRLMPLSARERRVWLADYRINQRGVHFDRASVAGAAKAIEKVKEDYDRRIAIVTGGAVASVGSLLALKSWATENGCPLESVAKQELADTIARLPEGKVRDALVLRQEAGKASTAKLDVMLSIAGPDNRLRNLYQYHGAATGRWAGRKVQPHNLTRDVPEDPAEVEHILSLFRDGNAAAIDMIYGPPLSVLSRCLRPMFCAAPGHVIAGGDWSNVEGRGVAWFAGEEWKLNAFREFDAGRGPDLYKVAYGKSFNMPPDEVTKPQRQIGKVMELAFGYQGGVGAFATMGKTLGVKVSDAAASRFKVGWRAAHPRVKAVWFALQRAAIDAVKAPGTVTSAGFPGREARFKVAGSFLWCLLPSGRAICYPYPKVLDGEYGPMLTYMTQPGPDDHKKGRVIYDPANTGSWARVSTYGGSLLENIVQGFCADFLREVLLAADEAGWPVVLHTHDDVNIEAPEAQAEEARSWLERAMNTPPAWAAGFPLFAKVSLSRRYGV